ncbi:MAG: hypothetical protein JXQ96_11465 [Cyclobacteriaceae bacterium]
MSNRFRVSQNATSRYCHSNFGGILLVLFTHVLRLSQRLSNRMTWSILFLIVLSLFAKPVSAQGKEEESKWEIKGYLKNMTSVTQASQRSFVENLVHNRLNFIYYANDNLTFYGELRNRIFVGDFVSEIPSYSRLIDNNNDYFDLSANLIDNRSLVFNTMIDRAYMQWNKNDWEIKLGRQRVNWGVNLAWNPNDWFNAYSFFDFDYEERRGSDAIRVNYYTGAASSVEVAVKMADSMDEFVGAALWKINKWNYDIQFQSGVANGDLALGLGWAGNLGMAGFKGEVTYLNPIESTRVNAGYDQMLLASISVDYSFKSSLYFNGSILYHSENSVDPLIGLNAIGNSTMENFTMRNLTNYRWSSFLQSAFQFSPLITGSVSVMAFPGTNALFLNPGFSYSLSQNVDLGVFGQVFFDEEILGSYAAIQKSVFVRLKWSF